MRQPACRVLVDSHYGIGDLLAVAIWSEYGDCRRFTRSDQAARHPGLDVMVDRAAPVAEEIAPSPDRSDTLAAIDRARSGGSTCTKSCRAHSPRRSMVTSISPTAI